MKKWLTLLAVILIVFIATFFPLQQNPDQDRETVTFTEIESPFTHQWDKSVYPFHGAAVIDIDSDETYEIFIGGGEGQDDVLFSYDGTFTEIEAGLSDTSATYGVVSLDVDNDLDVDMIIARENGLFFYFNDKGQFTKQEIPVELEENSVVFTVAPGDVNKDGFVDLYVSTFVNAENFKSARYNDPEHGKENILLLNNGDNTFTDITQSSRTRLDQNTFLSMFVDVNDDGWQDLLVSPNTGQVHLFTNNGDATFEKQVLTDYGFWMGLGIGDVDKDGDQDLFFSNAGKLAPDILLEGDLTDDQNYDGDWALLLNEDGNFVNSHSFVDHEFAWGAVLEDFNNDGYPELVVAENYVKWFAHKVRKFPGRFFMNDNGNFVPTTIAAGLENKHYGMSPLITDLNEDGYFDVILLNMDGPARVFLNDGGDTERRRVHIPDSVASIDKEIQMNGVTNVFVVGEGFMTDQVPMMIFPKE